VDESRYTDLFDRYVTHVSFWVKGEKTRNALTGQYEDPDERMMREVEALLGNTEEPADFRHGLIGTIAAWAIDHPGLPIDNSLVFSGHLRRLREAAFAERRTLVAKLCRDVVILLKEEGAGLNDARRTAAARAAGELYDRFGYQSSSAGDAAAALVRERFHQLLT
jgi:hypothetical protein